MMSSNSFEREWEEIDRMLAKKYPLHCEDSDDGYDAARDAYNMGYGPPVTRRQHEEDEMLREEYRRNGW